jgi:hypothetical protein
VVDEVPENCSGQAGEPAWRHETPLAGRRPDSLAVLRVHHPWCRRASSRLSRSAMDVTKYSLWRCMSEMHARMATDNLFSARENASLGLYTSGPALASSGHASSTRAAGNNLRARGARSWRSCSSSASANGSSLQHGIRSVTFSSDDFRREGLERACSEPQSCCAEVRST